MSNLMEIAVSGSRPDTYVRTDGHDEVNQRPSPLRESAYLQDAEGG